MKKIINTITISSLLLVSSVAFAHDGEVHATTSTTTIPQIKQIRADAKEDIKDLRLEAKNKIQDLLKNRSEHRFSKMVSQFERAIQKETELLARIQSRIEKIKLAGGQTADAEKLVLEAKTKLEAVKVKLDDLKAKAAEAIGDENSTTASSTAVRAHLAELKKITLEIKKDLIEIHRLLQKTVGLLRGNSQFKNASTTPTASTTSN